MATTDPPLPVDEILPALIQTLQHADSAILEAPPGAGKTTRVPIALLDTAVTCGDKILLLEPRRMAARSAAERMAAQLRQPVGDVVGYRIRGESKVSQNTRIEVITGGVLIRLLQSDPSLENVGLIVFDEFHERNIDSDLGLSLAMYGRDVFRESNNPLKLLVMSATLDGTAVSELLGDAPVLTSAGRMYPVEVIYRNRTADVKTIQSATAATVKTAVDGHEGDILVFLPGKKEINATYEVLTEFVQQKNITLHTLHGEMTLAQQRSAVAAGEDGQRKIVLASAIAESSLTIEGVRTVIDSGLSRLPTFDPRTAMTRLATRQSSKASADQRSGRAGRVAPGVCYRLWTEAQHDSRPTYTSAEINQADLAPLALTLFRFGVSTPDDLQWIDSPPAGAFSQATDLLIQLGALRPSPDGMPHTQTLTAHGEVMADFPLHPRLAHMLVTAQQFNLFNTACELAAILSGQDPLRNHSADINLRLALMNNHSGTPKKHGELLRLVNQIKRQCAAPDVVNKCRSLSSPDTAGFLLASAYPDRIARRRANGDYLLANGRAARLRDDDPLSAEEWLAVAHTGGISSGTTDTIYLAAALDIGLFEDELSYLVKQDTCLQWPGNKKALTAEQQWKIGDLLLRTDDTIETDTESRVAEVITFIRKKGLQILPWTPTTDAFMQRVHFVRNEINKPEPREEWPDFSTECLLATLERWLSPWLTTVSHINHFATLDMHTIMQAELPFEKKQQLDKLAPVHYRVPSGSALKIDYSAPEPVLAVKLQEMLGTDRHPTIGNGYPLKVSLLSPAGRQIQLTRDIPGFWAGSYAQVKKEMKSRYPKHYWPDDPAAATASSRTVKSRPR